MSSRILLVDDDRLLREVIGEHLSAFGYEVDLAEDLLAALRGGTNPAMLPLRHAVRGSLEPRFIPAAP